METAIIKFRDNPINHESILTYWEGYPSALSLPDGRRLVSPAGPEHRGMEHEDFKFVEVVKVNWKKPAGNSHVLANEIFTLDGDVLTIERVWEQKPQKILEDNKKTRTADLVDHFLQGNNGKIMYEIAKLSKPDMTLAEFQTLVEKVWTE